MKRQRECMTAEEAAERSALICRNIMQMRPYQNAKAILAYCAIGNEADLTPLLNHTLHAGKRVFLPVLTSPCQFEAREYKKEIPMVKNTFGIDEPLDGEPAGPEAFGLILVPGVVFDRRMHRIGFGAGFYDRYLAEAKSAFKIGVAYAFQIVDFIQEEPHDVCLDAVVSERDILYRL